MNFNTIKKLRIIRQAIVFEFKFFEKQISPDSENFFNIFLSSDQNEKYFGKHLKESVHSKLKQNKFVKN